MANKAYVYAIYPNKIQNEQCQKTFGCCRFVYNQMLTIQQDRYKNRESYRRRQFFGYDDAYKYGFETYYSRDTTDHAK